MKYLFLNYPKCSTCRDARKWLDANGIEYESRHIIEQNPTEEEIKKWILKNKLELKQLFNTNGQVYRKMQLRNRLSTISEAEQVKLLASDGRLVKRPLLISEEEGILIGFNPDVWKEALKNKK